MLEDFSRLVQLELRLLEAEVARSLAATVDRAIVGLVILYTGAMAGSCLLATLILLLHESMAWWQCFAIGGLAAIVCGLIAYACVRASLSPD